jgi:hypothetical protein
MIRLDPILLEPGMHNRRNEFFTVIAARMLLYPMGW